MPVILQPKKRRLRLQNSRLSLKNNSPPLPVVFQRSNDLIEPCKSNKSGSNNNGEGTTLVVSGQTKLGKCITVSVKLTHNVNRQCYLISGIKIVVLVFMNVCLLLQFNILHQLFQKEKQHLKLRKMKVIIISTQVLKKFIFPTV